MSEEYSLLSGVRYVEPNYYYGATSDICVAEAQGIHHYIYDTASGDCPAGCINHTYTGCTIDNDFNVVELGTYTSGLMDETEWF